jgi:hypothetical protein
LAVALLLPTAVLVDASPAAALTCAPNQIMSIRVVATQPTVVAGQAETLIAKALNCTNQTLTLTEIDTATRPPPCTDPPPDPNPDTFNPHQLVKNTIPWPTSNCPGTWSYKIALYQGTTLVAKSKASWIVASPGV